MNIIAKHINWLMLISGTLTYTMIYAAIAPEAALMSYFGESISGPVAEIVVRNWGALITLMGSMLIYGAFHAVHRTFVITLALISKVIFIGLVLSLGSQYLDKAGVAIGFDTMVVLLFIIYLATNGDQSSELRH